MALKLPRTTVGRAPSNDVVLDDARASRFHAVIDAEGTFFIIKDLCSKNGLYHNGKKVHARALASGNTLTIGECQVRLIAEEDYVEVVVESLPAPADLRADLIATTGRGLLTP
ncbi:pSer/pThr/pTyr-binding forkhead associated (FHA) protein [Variovorax guangxiensis]|nr:pSer/pThr/pTyr-binding forkhead associated (FHA) protein [Variovorax guangxiensis]